MPCAKPLLAVDYGYRINKNGERVRNIKLLDMRFKHINQGIEELKSIYGDRLLLLPCGKCYSCSCDYARMWSSRIMLEASNYDHNCFITLTYSDSFCPDKLYKRDFQLFMKRLRKEIGKCRFFACGELGDKSLRPHFHAIIFGFDFPDKVELQKSASGNIIYRSALLEKLWPFGISSIGTVTPESSQYVAKYSLKRKTSGVNSGEFVLMSRRPGIGFYNYDESIWDTDRLYLNGRNYKPPRFFEKIADKNHSQSYFIAKCQRENRSKQRVSSKYLYNLDREEQALKLENDLKIYNDCLKVRFQ